MLTLLLLRHAKAEPAAPNQADHDRNLTAKGRSDARRLGRWLHDIDAAPDLVIMSSARRVQQTVDEVSKEIGSAARLRTDTSLYEATPETILKSLTATMPAIGRLMVVGHNPGLAELAGELAKDGDHDDRARVRQHFPPCALAVLRFDEENWTDLRLTSVGCLDVLLTPNTLSG